MINTIRTQPYFNQPIVSNKPIISEKQEDSDRLHANRNQSIVENARKSNPNAFKEVNFNGRTYVSEGYLKEFENITKEFTYQMDSRNTEDVMPSPTTTIKSMEEKYQQLKKDITNNFSGEEQKKQLVALEKEFNLVMDQNILGKIDTAIEMSKGRVRMYEILQEHFGEKNFANSISFSLSKDEIKGWKEEINKIVDKFKEFKSAIGAIHKQDGAYEYAMGMADLLAINYNNTITKSLKEKYNSLDENTKSKINELEQLGKEKEKLLLSNDKDKTDMEKYQNAAKKKLELETIDKKMQAIYEEIGKRKK